MRTRVVVSIASLLLPATLSAQRIPLPGSWPGAKDPREMPRQPEPIARAVEYQRIRVSFEGYPAVSYVTTSGFLGGASAWTTLGAGTRAEYKLTRLIGATLDLTSSFIGGPVSFSSAELGTRLHQAPSAESPLQPYVDVRVGYLALSGWDTQADLGTLPGTRTVYGSGYSHGWAGIVGRRNRVRVRAGAVVDHGGGRDAHRHDRARSSQHVGSR